MENCRHTVTTNRSVITGTSLVTSVQNSVNNLNTNLSLLNTNFTNLLNRTLKIVPGTGILVTPSAVQNLTDNREWVVSIDPSYIGSTANAVLTGPPIPVRLATGRTLGKYQNNSSIPIEGRTFLQVLSDIATEVVDPTYILPLAVLSSSQSSNNLEVGQSVNIPLTLSFTQNDAGVATAYSISKDGAGVSITSTYTDIIPMTITPILYQGNIVYLDGLTKTNNLGDLDATGKILAGNINSNTLSYRGYYKVFYGSVATIPTGSTQARALSSRFENAGNTFTLNTGATNSKYVIICPPTKTLLSVVDQDALNSDITDQFTSSILTVNDAGGNPILYTMFAMQSDLPYSTNHRFNITLQ